MLTMVLIWVVFLLAQGTRAFLIHSPVYGRCLEASVGELRLQLKPCDLNCELQQWLLTDDQLLVNQGTQQPLSSQTVGPLLISPRNLSAHHFWQQAKSTLTCYTGALALISNGRDVILSHRNKQSQWMFLIEDDINRKQRSKRASGDSLQTEGPEEESDLRDEPKDSLRWFYRTVDSSTWTYTILALSLGTLLVGCMILVWGIMANRSRKAIARYEAVTQGLMMKELQSWKRVRGSEDGTTCNRQGTFTAIPEQGRAQVLRAGDILLTWKDGSVSIM